MSKQPTTHCVNWRFNCQIKKLVSWWQIQWWRKCIRKCNSTIWFAADNYRALHIFIILYWPSIHVKIQFDNCLWFTLFTASKLSLSNSFYKIELSYYTGIPATPYSYKFLFFSKIPIFSYVLINSPYISYIFMKNLEIALDKTLNAPV